MNQSCESEDLESVKQPFLGLRHIVEDHDLIRTVGRDSLGEKIVLESVLVEIDDGHPEGVTPAEFLRSGHDIVGIDGREVANDVEYREDPLDACLAARFGYLSPEADGVLDSPAGYTGTGDADLYIAILRLDADIIGHDYWDFRDRGARIIRQALYRSSHLSLSTVICHPWKSLGDCSLFEAMTNVTHTRPGRPLDALRDFLRLESAGGVLLFIAALLAMLIANSPLESLYDDLLETTVAVQIGRLAIDKPLLLWINDGLMAVFFFLIGLEVKREILEGELSSPKQIVLPGLGALGGMLVPAAIYAWLNWGDVEAMDGWAIPVATDIAFALGLLSVFRNRMPTSLKVFLLTLAIFDDLAAIVIIALFYSEDLSLVSLLVGLAVFATAVVMNRMRVVKTSAYVLLGILLWVAVLKSGVHATLAGVLIAFCIPMQGEDGRSPLRDLEHDLHGPVAFAILPLFAFANAGLALGEASLADVTHPVTMGIVAGLFLGKPLGILFFVGLAVALRLVKLPQGVTWTQLAGVSAACGIGFTMSLFIAGLAFQHGADDYFAGDRLGILVGSAASAVLAYVLLQISLPSQPAAEQGSGS